MTEEGVSAADDGGGCGDAGPGAGSTLAGAPFSIRTLLTVADSLPVMIAYVDREERYIFANLPIADWFEVKRSDMIGKTLRELMPADHYRARSPQFKAALAGEVQRFVATITHPTRGPLTTRSEFYPDRNAAGEVIGAILITQDITEQRATEEALRESEARFQRIADSAPLPMWVTRIDRSRDFVNEAYLDLLGLSREEAQNADWMARIHPEDRPRIIADTIAGEKSGGTFVVEGRFERRPGDWRWMSVVSQPRFNPAGDRIGYIGVASDVSALRRGEQELRELVEARTAELSESEQRFRAIFDTVMEIIVLMKPDGTVLEVNRTEAVWRSSDPRAAVGRKLWEAPTFSAHPEHRAFARVSVERAARGEIVTAELLMNGVEGNATIDVSLRAVRDGRERIIFLLLEVRDVTELKVAQDQLRQSQKMEALGQLTGGIAHDFNNLLTVVVGGLDMISKQLVDEKLKRYATNALSAAERGVRLTGQLLTFSRSQRLEVRPCFIGPLVQEMRPLLRNVLGPGIEKRFELDELDLPVMGDPTQIEVAVLNLAINARDAMPHGGSLTFVSRGVWIDDDPELDTGNYIELIVSDTGMGMPSEVAARVFEPFFTTKEVGKGTGLGLSMVYGMARQSGGTARVVSEEGKGTSISLFFRQAEGAGEATGEPMAVRDTSSATGQSASVLVIDDDPDVRGFIVTSLEEQGYRVAQASDGPGGIALVAALQPDVVVIDYVMPGMTGAEAAAAILANRPDQALLFVSGYNETDDIKRAAPNAAILTKPFRPDALNAAVRSALAGSRDAERGAFGG